jgi:hypothetical protein
MAVGIEKVQADPAYSSNSKYSGTVTDNNADSTSYLDFESYLKVLVAQMSNQDFNNPMSDSEFMTQMASYSTLEAINNMTKQSGIQYASSLTGKAVTVSDGTNYEMGIVDSVIITDGKPKLLINGNAYDTKHLTDVVSDTLYAIMESLKGTEVSYNTDTMSGKGIVTGGLVANGKQFLILDGDRVVPLSGITLPSGENAGEAVDEAEKNGETSLEGTGSTDGTGSTEAQGAANGTDGANGTEAQGAANGTDGANGTNSTDPDDAVDGVSAPDVDALSARAPAADNLPLGVIGGHYLYSDTVEATRTYAVDNLSAPAYSEEGVLPPLTEQGLQAFLNNLATTRASLDDPGVGAISLDDYLVGSGQVQASDEDEDDDIIPEDGGDDAWYNNTGTGTSTNAVSNAERFTSPYPNTIYQNENPGVLRYDAPKYRKYGYEYPAEAKLADAFGTRMFDIRYITNTTICDRIDTSNIIGQSASGRAITEIGFSGQGQLGEVNTYSDGTQRVEVIFSEGQSGWYYTSGRYTLNQIIDRKNWIRDLTPQESDLRHYATVYSAAEQAELDRFEEYIMEIF